MDPNTNNPLEDTQKLKADGGDDDAPLEIVRERDYEIEERATAELPVARSEAGAPAPEDAEAPPASSAPGFFRKSLRLLPALFSTWIALPIVLPFIILFLMTALPRMWSPFDLEWMEGQTGEQALRFAEGKPMYPASTSEWVPYIYAPLYHIAMGGLFKITGSYELGWGRLISVISTLLAALGIMAIVRERARRWAPAVIAGLLFFAYYQPTGFWFDIARSDSMAYALCVWGMFFTLKRRPNSAEIGAGLLLLTLATLTKQPVGAVAIYCGLRLLAVRFHAARLWAALLILFSVNFVFFFQAAGNDGFMKYAYEAALKHPDNDTVWYPKYQGRVAFTQGLPKPAKDTYLERQKVYWKEYLRQSKTDPPWIWKDCLKYVWVVAALYVASLALGLLALPFQLAAKGRREWLNSLLYVPPAFLLAWGGFAGLAKSGGYINNFLPVFVAASLLAGFAIEGIWRAFPPFLKFIPNLAVALALFAQLYLPDSVDPIVSFRPLSVVPDYLPRGMGEGERKALKRLHPKAGDAELKSLEAQTIRWQSDKVNKARYEIRRSIADPSLLKKVNERFLALDNAEALARKLPGAMTPTPAPAAAPSAIPAPGAPVAQSASAANPDADVKREMRRYALARWGAAGLLWLPSAQLPAPGSDKAYSRLMAWLKKKKEAGQPVWVMHHQWYAWKAGHTISLNVDMVRCASLAGIQSPPELGQTLSLKRYPWLVLDSADLKYEWLPIGLPQAIEQNYDSLGPLPIYAGEPADRKWMEPLTGAPSRPYILYRAKGFAGEPDFPPAD